MSRVIAETKSVVDGIGDEPVGSAHAVHRVDAFVIW